MLVDFFTVSDSQYIELVKGYTLFEMGGKKKNTGQQLGRAIIKDRFGKGRGRARRGDPTMVKQPNYQTGVVILIKILSLTFSRFIVLSLKMVMTGGA